VGRRSTRPDAIALALAFVAFTALVVSSAAITITRRTTEGPRWVRPAAFFSSGLGVVTYLVLPRVIGRQHAPGGRVECIFLAAELAWLSILMLSLVMADGVERTTSPPVEFQPQAG